MGVFFSMNGSERHSRKNTGDKTPDDESTDPLQTPPLAAFCGVARPSFELRGHRLPISEHFTFHSRIVGLRVTLRLILVQICPAFCKVGGFAPSPKSPL